MTDVLRKALSDVCDELAKHDDSAPCLHFARGLLASAAPLVAPPAAHGSGILEATATAFGFTVAELQSSKRPQPLCEARFAAMLVLRRAGESLPRIGALFMRDHCTVIHGIARAEKLEASSEVYAAAVKQISDGSVSGIVVERAGPMKRAFHNPAKLLEMAKAYESGKGLHLCAVEFHTSPETIRRACVLHGVEIRPKGGGKKWVDTSRIDRIMELRSEGKSGEEIAREFGITRERVRQIVVAAGKWEEFSVRPLTPEQIALCQEYHKGKSICWLREQLGVSEPTAKKYLSRSGIPLRPNKRKEFRKRRAEQIARRYRAGDSIAEIARAYGMKHKEAVYRQLAIAGVSPDRKLGA